MINLELTTEQAKAAIYALLLHTKDDSVEFPSDRVKLLREVNSGAINYCITNAVKCFPPLNRPLQSEINNCLRHLKKEISVIQPNFILCLGVIAHNAAMRACREDSFTKFQHGNSFKVGQRIIFDSYHPSKRNISTKRLTREMFRIILKKIIKEIEKVTPSE